MTGTPVQCVAVECEQTSFYVPSVANCATNDALGSSALLPRSLVCSKCPAPMSEVPPIIEDEEVILADYLCYLGDMLNCD